MTVSLFRPGALTNERAFLELTSLIRIQTFPNLRSSKEALAWCRSRMRVPLRRVGRCWRSLAPPEILSVKVSGVWIRTAKRICQRIDVAGTGCVRDQ